MRKGYFADIHDPHKELKVDFDIMLNTRTVNLMKELKKK